MSENTTVLLIILGTLVAVVILMTCRKYVFANKSCDPFATNLPDPDATTKMEMVSEKVYEIIKQNQEDQEDYASFITALKKEGINHPKIDMKFYMTIAQAYRNRLLTRAYIINKLTNM